MQSDPGYSLSIQPPLSNREGEENDVKKRRRDTMKDYYTGQEALTQDGHYFHNLVVTGHSRPIIGDFHYHGPAQATRYQLLLSSLLFDRMDARLRNIAAPLPKTCEWLFHHEQFTAWADTSQMHQHHGFLWVKGKPGSGKSTIMKEAFAWAEKTWTSDINISYFFNARSSGQLEKSTIGLYRSLLHQLLSAFASGSSLFEKTFGCKVRNDCKVEPWEEIELQNFLTDFILTLALPPVNIFIDALDESSSDADTRRMIRYLERLTKQAMVTSRQLRICLSSRHYPHLAVRYGLTLVVEHQLAHNQDIELYIRDELVEAESPQMDGVRCAIRDRSEGVFLWVVLVIPILNKAYDRGRSSLMMQILKEIPSSLQAIFQDNLLRYTADMDERSLLLRWVLYALRPLKPNELYCAIQFLCLHTKIDEDVRPEEDTIARYLLDCSRGLIEITVTEPHTIQFIHETVRDYLLSSGAANARVLFASDAEDCHLKIAEECLRYLLALRQKVPLSTQKLRRYTLARYAAESWWRHMQRSRNVCLQEHVDLVSSFLNDSPVNALIWAWPGKLERWSDPNKYLARRIRNQSPPIYYAASTGINRIMVKVLSLGNEVNARGKHGSALHIAAAYGYSTIVQTLLEHNADVNIRGGAYGTALQAASTNNMVDAVHLLIKAGADVNHRGGLYGSAIQAASECGYDEIVQALLDAKANVNTHGRQGAILTTSSLMGHQQVVRVLVDAGADLGFESRLYGTALRAASQHGHIEVVWTLLNSDKDTSTRGKRLASALYAASRYGHSNLVQLLIKEGVDVNARETNVDVSGVKEATALQAASYYDHEKVIRILVNAGADVQALGGKHQFVQCALSKDGPKCEEKPRKPRQSKSASRHSKSDDGRDDLATNALRLPRRPPPKPSTPWS